MTKSWNFFYKCKSRSSDICNTSFRLRIWDIRLWTSGLIWASDNDKVLYFALQKTLVIKSRTHGIDGSLEYSETKSCINWHKAILAWHWLLTLLLIRLLLAFKDSAFSSMSITGGKQFPFSWTFSAPWMRRLRHSSSITFSITLFKKAPSLKLTKSMHNRFLANKLSKVVNLNLMCKRCCSCKMLPSALLSFKVFKIAPQSLSKACFFPESAFFRSISRNLGCDWAETMSRSK